ncbi:hypothetical protein J6590_028565 [Homalodisca vitripennis]|nr:hypothetical protein J6590_028565 [Homalodisca vitripennis]
MYVFTYLDGGVWEGGGCSWEGRGGNFSPLSTGHLLYYRTYCLKIELASCPYENIASASKSITSRFLDSRAELTFWDPSLINLWQ